MASQQFALAQNEGLCLRYPDSVGTHRELTIETAVNMLLRAAQIAQTVPFVWGYIDKPSEGQTYVLFLPPDRPFPNDGIRYQDSETKFVVPIGTGREMEIGEVKFGFIPNSQDQQAWRLRRRYRLIKGSHPQLVLVHYTRGPSAPINPNLFNQPVRPYPLRVINEPSVFVAGERAGQKVPPPQPQGNFMSGQVPPGAPGVPPMNVQQQQAMVAHQNSNMEMLERRQRERQAAERGANQPPRPPRPEDDDSGDEVDQVSARTLAMARYKRNHEFMNDVFQTAAFGKRTLPPKPSPYSIFSQAELSAKVAKLQDEIEQLKKKSDERRVLAEEKSQKDVSMGSLGEGITI